MPHTPTILLTFDVEDWFQVENLRSWFQPESWDRQQRRVVQNTHKILDLLDLIELPRSGKHSGVDQLKHAGLTKLPYDQAHPKATFFILGWIAEREPDLIREIKKRGHEVASHGFNHLMCNQMRSDELKQDLERSKYLLEDITGDEVIGYRAPNFSIGNTALKLVRNCGYKYDSSYNNFSKHGRYGTLSLDDKAKAESVIHLGDGFRELKISNLVFANCIAPWGGGGYFRLLPSFFFNFGVQWILSRNETYIFYLHPWELDPEQPRLKGGWLQAWRHYLNLGKTQTRLHNLITSFNYCNFPTCSQYIDTLEQSGRFPN